jgi:hypothetical protein
VIELGRVVKVLLEQTLPKPNEVHCPPRASPSGTQRRRKSFVFMTLKASCSLSVGVRFGLRS